MSQQDKYAELSAKSEEVLVSYSADVTGKGCWSSEAPSRRGAIRAGLG